MLVDDDDDDNGEGGGEGSDGVLRTMGLGSLGAGVSGFGSSFTSGFSSALGSLEVKAMGDAGFVARCFSRRSAMSAKVLSRVGEPVEWAGVAVPLGARLGMRLGGRVPGRLFKAATADRRGLAPGTGAGGGWLSQASISCTWLGLVLR